MVIVIPAVALIEAYVGSAAAATLSQLMQRGPEPAESRAREGTGIGSVLDVVGDCRNHSQRGGCSII